MLTPVANFLYLYIIQIIQSKPASIFQPKLKNPHETAIFNYHFLNRTTRILAMVKGKILCIVMGQMIQSGTCFIGLSRASNADNCPIHKY